MPSRPGIIRSSTRASMAGRFGINQPGHGGVAAIDHDGLIAAALHHVFHQAALDGVVVGDQDSVRPWQLQSGYVPNWATMAIKALMLS